MRVPIATLFQRVTTRVEVGQVIPHVHPDTTVLAAASTLVTMADTNHIRQEAVVTPVHMAATHQAVAPTRPVGPHPMVTTLQEDQTLTTRAHQGTVVRAADIILAPGTLIRIRAHRVAAKLLKPAHRGSTFIGKTQQVQIVYATRAPLAHINNITPQAQQVAAAGVLALPVHM